MKYIGLIILMYALVALSGLLFIGVLLGSFWIKKNISNMNEVKWEDYFKSMSNTKYILKFCFIYLIALIIVTILSQYIYGAFNFKDTKTLAFITFVFGFMKMIWIIIIHKKEMLSKIEELRRK